jgi:hypothetical protein
VNFVIPSGSHLAENVGTHLLGELYFDYFRLALIHPEKLIVTAVAASPGRILSWAAGRKMTLRMADDSGNDWE